MKSNAVLMFFSFMLISLADGWGQTDYPWLRSGDVLYQNGGFPDAETAYRKALEEKEKPTTSYNLGNTIYQQNRIPEAVQQYQKTVDSTKDPALKSDAYYNLGNAHFQNKAYEESIKAYKESLKIRPDDEDAKKNLMLAMRQYQQQQQQQKQKEQENKQDPSEENQDQQQQHQQNQEQEDENQSSSPQNQPQPNEDQQKTPEKVSQEEAREILKAIEREDQRVQEKLKKAAGKTAPPVKDW